MRNTVHDYSQRTAVLIPCHNEAVAIPNVIRQFHNALPGARICVFDNNSSDNTAELARMNGAEVRFVRLQGKGNVVRRMFADIDADIYILVDGDATYDAQSAAKMVERLLRDGLDMVVGVRKETEQGSYRRGHRFGNRIITGCVGLIFGGTFTDMLSGYRVFSKRYVKSFPAQSKGFETETELTVHALELRMPWAEVETPYAARPSGSTSKLSTFKDGLRIFAMIVKLYKEERPFSFFTWIAVVFTVFGWGIAVPLFITYFHTGQVPRIPTAVLATGIQILSVLSFVCGVVLDTVTTGRKELKRLAYLSVPSEAERIRQKANSKERNLMNSVPEAILPQISKIEPTAE